MIGHPRHRLTRIRRPDAVCHLCRARFRITILIQTIRHLMTRGVCPDIFSRKPEIRQLRVSDMLQPMTSSANLLIHLKAALRRRLRHNAADGKHAHQCRNKPLHRRVSLSDRGKGRTRSKCGAHGSSTRKYRYQTSIAIRLSHSQPAVAGCMPAIPRDTKARNTTGRATFITGR